MSTLRGAPRPSAPKSAPGLTTATYDLSYLTYHLGVLTVQRNLRIGCPPQVVIDSIEPSLQESIQSVGLSRQSIGCHLFGPGGCLFKVGDRIQASTYRILYLAPIPAHANIHTVVCDLGSAKFDNIPPDRFPEDFQDDFLCFLAYIRLRGLGAARICSAFAQFIRFPPFLLSIARVLHGDIVTQLDFVLIRETLRAQLRSWLGEFANDVLSHVGRVASNLIAGSQKIELPIRANVWLPDVVPDTKFELKPAPHRDFILREISGEFEPIRFSEAVDRTTITIVRGGDRRSHLILGKRDGIDGRHVLLNVRENKVFVRAVPRALNWKMVDQVTVVLLDCSSSMSLCQGNERKFQIACRILDRFRDHLQVPHAAFGFSVFTADGASPIVWAIPKIVSERAVVRGSICLALNLVLHQILSNKDCAPLRKRVFLITDGLSKSDDMTEVANRCISSRVIVDGVILSETFPMVAPLCMVTGGYAFNHKVCPIDGEEFVDLNLRGPASNLTQVTHRLLISMRDTLTFSSGLSFADPVPQTDLVTYCGGTRRRGRIVPICHAILYRRYADNGTSKRLVAYNFFARVTWLDNGPICSLSSIRLLVPICSSPSKTVEKREGKSSSKRNGLSEFESH
jgi:hypothetical protein